MKKKILSLALAFASFASFASCGFLGNGSSNSGGDSASDSVVEETYTFETVFSSTEQISLKSGESKEYAINKNIAGKDYIKLSLRSNANLLGAFTYKNVDDPAQVVSEDFYIEPSAENIEFKQFLDAFRGNGIGVFKKELVSITLKNLDAHEANVTLSDVSVSDREVPAFEKEIYIEKDYLKVGADLAMGGTLSYLEKTEWEGLTIDEIIDHNGDVTIDVGAAEDAKIALSSSVNLINIFDAGREIQQSYYADVGGSMQEATGANGYDRRWSYTATREGYYWPYNPVQGGDEVCNLSQIIDYEQGDNYIYVKVRAMDWGNGFGRPEVNHPDYELYKNGRTSKSYIENWYTIKDGMLYVDNRFIDWNGFTNMEDIPKHTLEIPATYIVHPFHTFVCYTGHDAWNLNDNSYDRQKELGGWWDENAHVNEHHPEDWFAWVNNNNFGVGIYVPGAGGYVSGRNDRKSDSYLTNNRTAYESKMATQFLYNKVAPTSMYTTCYVGNTSYTAPVANVRMKEYVALSYTYVIAVDYLDIFRSNFKAIYESGEVTNEGLKAWD